MPPCPKIPPQSRRTTEVHVILIQHRSPTRTQPPRTKEFQRMVPPHHIFHRHGTRRSELKPKPHVVFNRLRTQRFTAPKNQQKNTQQQEGPTSHSSTVDFTPSHHPNLPRPLLLRTGEIPFTIRKASCHFSTKQAVRHYYFCCDFNRSRISVSSFSSLLGSGGATGSGAGAGFLAILFIARTAMNITSAMIKKSTTF